MADLCPLCENIGDLFYEHEKKGTYFRCKTCFGIFIDAALWPSDEEEKARYEEHNNDVENKGYQNFVAPISSAILNEFSRDDKGLDFGAGTGPVISKILDDHGYDIVQYDPYFHNYPNLLKRTYDYIACCEVIEHFHHPKKEFHLLNKLLNKKGKLYIMTDLYDEDTTFHNWYYMNDITHVFIYHEKTIHWIKDAYDFSEVTIDERLIIFNN
ncbi:class I SAM-dependent methyltransferase [Sungkyunkwania multivorans]|uniref:Class I SAM-dependent methyltransferase n=1 Tax=Sungkyunkwania multivorans TaxID=1173618 RepID=A0ABW3CZV4_9FLAO